MLISLAPLRDRRERAVGALVHSHAFTAPRQDGGSSPDTAAESLHARELLEYVPALSRLAGQTLLVRTTPGLVHDGSLQQLAELDVVWMLRADELFETALRRDMVRQIGGGLHFAIEGFPEGERLPNAFAESLVVLDAAVLSPAMLEIRGRMLLEAGLRPAVVGVDDRVTRQRAMQAGAQVIGGRPLTRGAAIAPDRSAEESILRAINVLAIFSEGRPPDASFDAYIREDPYIAASLLKVISSAAIGIRSARTVEHAIQLLGRDTIVDRLLLVAGRMIGEVGGDGDLAVQALRRARLCAMVGPAIDPTAHARGLHLAGVLSMLEFALGMPSHVIASRLTLPASLSDVLLQRERRIGQLIDAIDAFECGWWPSFFERCAALGIDPARIGDGWLEAWGWAREELATSRGDFL